VEIWTSPWIPSPPTFATMGPCFSFSLFFPRCVNFNLLPLFSSSGRPDVVYAAVIQELVFATYSLSPLFSRRLAFSRALPL